MAHISTNKAKLLARVRRIAGQVAALERAIATDAECSAVLQQAAAARGALGGLVEVLILDHLEHHVAAPGLDEAARRRGADELITILGRYKS
ncbi:metal-sensing transcriptional repressor [Sandaracinobacter neustonicus]|jgi:DNA-binding FrmR family transcriptional regulator|uniref:Metal-sensing transcriptional repressor n=1 Tax=Sandaracinobacter neustonicus TaxID=1715348 RepID=A0A501XJH2_9SPHN|nr:metal-sensing transcriptional repressor [Sandaracinobacter neustonicus]TPE60706.1 metal-sensing transcriptional repressor [Sandaracinobacter neustonicus]